MTSKQTWLGVGVFLVVAGVGTLFLESILIGAILVIAGIVAIRKGHQRQL